MKQRTDVSLLANVVNMSDTCACLLKKKKKSILTKYHFLPVHCCIILSTYIKIILLLEKKIIKQCMGENGTLMARIGLRTVQMLNYQMGV